MARAPCGAILPGPMRQRGAALVCALVLMLAAMLVAASVCRAVFASIASAGAERERSLAHEAAEAALRDAERDIAAAAGTEPARAAQFTAAGAASFVDGCGRAGSARGLCSASSPPAWQALDLAEPGNPALVPYGYFTGATLRTGKGLLPARPPAYLIEHIAPPGAGEPLGSFYRITAIGFGSNAATRVVLQSVYRKPKPAPPGTGNPSDDPGPRADGPAAPGPPATGPGAGNGNDGNAAATPPAQLPAGRIGWREIANWPRLHAEAVE
ncbi:PilX N-terminal domain-containing pilus assembly protein [Massilia sp. LXY-6]|uniref:pilus assembly PilX family protein n=1 Tax=Massilia sp. LXY-6 TaxID=3379823 RepID=UPI003EE18E60